MSLVFCILPVFYLSMIHAAETINWERGVQLATDANSELNAARSSLQSSHYQVKVARSGFFPVVSATAAYTHDSTEAPKSYTTSINATENIFAGFSDSAKVDRAQFSVSSTQASLASTKAKVSFDLKTSFMGLIYSQKYIALTKDIIKRREANLKLVQLRFESGRENIGSLNLSKAYLAQARYDHLQALNSLDVYQAQLARVLGIEDFAGLEVEGMVPVTAPPYEDNRKLDYKNLIKDLPDYKKAFFDEQIAKSNIDLSRSAFFPTINLTQSAGRTGREYNSPANTWSIGANLTFPLFSGGKDYYSTKSATEDYRASSYSRRNIEENSVARLKDLYTKYVESVMKLEVDDAFVLAASSRERIAKAQYNNGLISFLDWDTIENDLINRQKSLLQAQRDRVNAEAAWEQVQGRGVIP